MNFFRKSTFGRSMRLYKNQPPELNWKDGQVMTLGRPLVNSNANLANLGVYADVTGNSSTRSVNTRWYIHPNAPTINQRQLGNESLLQVMPSAANDAFGASAARLGKRVMLTGIDLEIQFFPRYMYVTSTTAEGLDGKSWCNPLGVRFWLFWLPYDKEVPDTEAVDFKELLQWDTTADGIGAAGNQQNVELWNKLPYYMGPRRWKAVANTVNSYDQRYYNGGRYTSTFRPRPQMISTWKMLFKHKPQQRDVGPDEAYVNNVEYVFNDVPESDTRRGFIQASWLNQAMKQFAGGENLAPQTFKKRLKINKVIDFSSVTPLGVATQEAPGKFILAYTTNHFGIEGTSTADVPHVQQNRLGVTVKPRFYWYDMP